jgi:protein SCO1/2
MRTVWLAAAIAAAMAGAPAVADQARWGADYFPNVTLTTHEGTKVRFYDDLIKGRIVAIDLIYTTCQYACPLETARMVQVQRVLGDRVGRDIFFYSITIDPDHDTPAVLKEYAEKYHVGPGWLFLTGKASDIELISKKLGLYTEKDASNPDGHTPTLLVGNQTTGQWMRNSALDNPKFLARTIGDWLNNWESNAKRELASFAEVPMLNFDQGQYTFKNHCAACHTIGGGDAIGPDLKGVTTSRERQWLARFIATPDEVFAENDPIAHALLERYKQVRMPNLSLSDQDAAVLIDYIARESGDTAAIASGTSGGRPMASMGAMPGTPAIERDGPRGSASPPAASKEIGGRASPSSSVRDPKALLEPYLRMHQALAGDTLDGMLDSAVAIATEAAMIGSRAAKVKAAVNPFAQVKDLNAAREAFAALSDAVIDYVRTSDAPLGEGVHVAYCPMARKYWVQKGTAIQNPFYGQTMADCGRMVP